MANGRVGEIPSAAIVEVQARCGESMNTDNRTRDGGESATDFVQFISRLSV